MPFPFMPQACLFFQVSELSFSVCFSFFRCPTNCWILGDGLLQKHLWGLQFLRILRNEFYRARDSPDDEEKEILSSTSSNVREIWDGNRVVRQTGESKTVPLIYNSKLKSLAAMCDDPRFAMTLSNSLEKSGMLSYVLTSVVPGMMLQFPQQEKQRLPHDISLNLTLNTSTGIPRKRTVSLLVIIGLLIQAAVVVVNAFAVYRWQWVKSGKPIERYAYPIWATGTGAITIGVWLCGWVVESSSEKRLVTGYGDELRIIFMQQKLPTQNIPAYAIEPISTGKKMMYSRRLWPSTLDYDSSSQVNGTWRARQYRLRVTCVAIGTLLTLFGFVGQNIGTRGLHWSAGLLQLGATAAVTILRAVIRRKVGRLVDDKATNAIEELESGFEACHLSTKLIGLELYLASFPITIQTARFKDQYLYTILDIEENEISLGDDDDGKYDTLVKRIIEAQILLTRHVPEVKAVKKAAASCLKAMDEILDLVLPEHEEDAWKDIGAFLCVALNHLGTRAARSTDEDGKRFPKFRLIKAPTRREERLRLVQAVFSSTRYTYRKRLDFDFGIDPDFKLAPRILGHCADDDAEARRQLLSAWVESHRKPQEPSRVHISQALGPTATEAEEPVEFLRVSPIFFGLPLKHGFWNAM